MAGEPILVVDDHRQNLKLAEVILTAEGYDVRTAVDAESALEVLDSFAPRLILMDLQLPGMDGFELARRLKQAPGTRNIAIIALTAHAMDGDEERVLAAGFDGYISKPMDIPALREIVAGHVRRAGAGGAGA
jgi:CheY-like chemotaxis protein